MNKVLIIDDEEDILDLLEEYLACDKNEIFKAKSVPEALRYLQKQTFKIVVSDLVLETGKGESVLRYMRQPGGIHQNTPILLISGKVEKPNDLKGKTSFLAKPFSQEEFLTAINRLIKKPAKKTSSQGVKKKSVHPSLKKIIGK